MDINTTGYWTVKFTKEFKNGKFCRGCTKPMLPPDVNAGEFARVFGGQEYKPIPTSNLLFVTCQNCGFCDIYNLDLLQSQKDGHMKKPN